MFKFEAKSKLKGGMTLVGAVLVVVALLVYFLPRETKFGYEYEQGRPWRYNSLIATFDFPIYKTQQEVEAESDSALANFQPFYVENAQMGQRQIAAFHNDFVNGAFNDVPASNDSWQPSIKRVLSTRPTFHRWPKIALQAFV